MPNQAINALDFALQQDQLDELKDWREQFVNDDPDLIYLDGNSLGRLPKTTVARISHVVNEEWGRGLIRSWNEGWYDAPMRIGDKIGQLIGASTSQVIVSDSTSVNLYKAILSALALRPGRTRIVTDELNFPSDLYILEGVIHQLGDRHELVIVRSMDGLTIDNESLHQAVDQETALVVLSHVAFKSGFLYDMGKVTDFVHQAGALILWDLSHSVGAVPINLDSCQVDFAVGCTYKYLNGGPGSPAFLYLRKELQAAALSPVWGWFGDSKPFSFDLDYSPATGIKRFLCGTPPLLSLLAIEVGVDILLEARLDRLYKKTTSMSAYLIHLVEDILIPMGFVLGSPRDVSKRGSHISLQHSEGYRINRALIEDMKVIPDFREPDNIRLGIAPIYTSYQDLWQAVDRIRQIMLSESYKKYPSTRSIVT